MSYLSLIRPARPAIVDQLALDSALAAGASAAAEKYSKRAHAEEPNGPPQKTPQAKW